MNDRSIDGMDDRNVQVLCKQLQQLGFREVEVVDDGEEAVPRVLSRVPPFDLVFMDLHMSSTLLLLLLLYCVAPSCSYESILRVDRCV